MHSVMDFRCLLADAVADKSSTGHFLWVSFGVAGFEQVIKKFFRIGVFVCLHESGPVGIRDFGVALAVAEVLTCGSFRVR